MIKQKKDLMFASLNKIDNDQRVKSYIYMVDESMLLKQTYSVKMSKLAT